MSSTLGQTLQIARQERGVSLDDVSKATHIRPRYLQALESDDFGSLPSLVQGRGFLRLYADYLGLDTPSLLAQMSGRTAEPVPAVASDQSPVSPAAELPPVNVQAPAEDQPAAEDSEPVLSAEEPVIDPAPVPVTIEHSGKPPSFLKHSQQIFADLGRDLCAQRELLSLSLTDVEKHTRLRVHYLKALEEGRMQDMPSFVQARGMLANYAHFLNLDSEAYLLRFADALQARREELVAMQAQTTKATSGKRSARISMPRFLSVDLLVTSGLIVLLVAFITWGASRVLTLRSAVVKGPTAPAVVDVLLASPSPSESTAETTPEPTTPEPAASGSEAPTIQISLPASLPSGAIQLSVVAHQRAWMLITADGKVQFNGRTIPGNTYSFSGNKQIELLTGSGAALQAYFKNTDLGVLGSVGQVVDLIFTPDGVANPTPSITPSATRTSRVTPTASATSKPPAKTTPQPPAAGQ